MARVIVTGVVISGILVAMLLQKGGTGQHEVLLRPRLPRLYLITKRPHGAFDLFARGGAIGQEDLAGDGYWQIHHHVLGHIRGRSDAHIGGAGGVTWVSHDEVVLESARCQVLLSKHRNLYNA